MSAARVLRGVVIAGLLIGTATHLENIVRAGAIPRPELPLAYNVFWTSLVAIDPIAALLVYQRPRVGLPVTAAIMAVDLAVNLDAFGLNVIVGTQLVFAGIVAVAWVLTVRSPAAPAMR